MPKWPTVPSLMGMLFSCVRWWWSVVDWAKVELVDGSRGRDGGGREMALPVRRVDAASDEVDVAGVESLRDEVPRGIAEQQAIEDAVGSLVGDPEVVLVGLAADEVGRGRLRDDLF